MSLRHGSLDEIPKDTDQLYQPFPLDVLGIPTNQHHHAAQLPAQILPIHIMGILHLAPHARLPTDLHAASLRRLLNPESVSSSIFLSISSNVAAILVQRSKPLTPLHHQADRHQQTLTGQHAALQRRQLIRRQARHPAPDDLPRHLGLLARHDARLVQHGVQLRAGPDARGQIREDGEGGAALQVAEGVAGAGGVVLGLGGGVVGVGWGRPAEEGVRVEVAEQGLQDVGSRVGGGGGGWRFLVWWLREEVGA